MEAACMFCVLQKVTRSFTRACTHGVYIYALHNLLKAWILCALEEHSYVNSLALSYGNDHRTFSLLTGVSLSCYTLDLLTLSHMVRHKFLFNMHATAIC